jgi:hypothetical protein
MNRLTMYLCLITLVIFLKIVGTKIPVAALEVVNLIMGGMEKRSKSAGN